MRVHGNMRTFESKRTIVAFNIRPIMDFNEVPVLPEADIVCKRALRLYSGHVSSRVRPQMEV